MQLSGKNDGNFPGIEFVSRKKALKDVMKIAFVIPWYGEKIPGGAETECRRIAENLQNCGVEVEILTTCVKEFLSDWGHDFYEEGDYCVNGILVRRFPVRKRDAQRFDIINYKLMRDLKVSPEEERIFIQEMVNSDSLYSFIKNRGEDYDVFVFIPYMFGTTFYGSQIHPEKSILIPCLHDESYAHMAIYKPMFEMIQGIIFLSDPEKEFANKMFDIKKSQAVLGGGVDTERFGDAERFRSQYNITDDFILYAGRRDSGKNLSLIMDFFCRYKKKYPSPMKFILIGSGEVTIPNDCDSDIIDLGFVSNQEKYDAYAAATVLCQPSKNESFSIVIMESWLCETPVLVHADCAVTRDHCIKSNGGLFFREYAEFEECLRFLMKNPKKRDIMGKKGRAYVLSNYSWNCIVNKYMKFLSGILSRKT